ncbi:hypothetical protein ACSBR2_018564 [Camellia fascicularis]
MIKNLGDFNLESMANIEVNFINCALLTNIKVNFVNGTLLNLVKRPIQERGSRLVQQQKCRILNIFYCAFTSLSKDPRPKYVFSICIFQQSVQLVKPLEGSTTFTH